LQQESPGVAKNLNQVLKEVDQLVSENRDNLRASMDKLKEATVKLDQTLLTINNLSQGVDRGEGTIGKLFKDDKAYNNLNEG